MMLGRQPAVRTGRREHTRRTPLYAVLQALAQSLMPAFFRVRVFGRENVPREGGVLIASNHQSFLDPLLIGLGLPRPVTFMARSTLFRWRPFAWLIRALNAFPVRQGRTDLGAVRKAIRRMRAGWALLVFPEGTRTRDGRIGVVRRGFEMMAVRGGVPVVPAAIDGAFESWPRHRLLFRPGAIYVAFGRPLSVADGPSAGRAVLHERVRAEMLRLACSLKEKRQRVGARVAAARPVASGGGG